MSVGLILIFRQLMFGLIRHRSLLQRNISINVGKLTAIPSELMPKKPKLTKLTKGSSNQITSFNERGAQITITKYSEIELEDMIEEGKIEAENEHKTPFMHRIVGVFISCLGYYFIVPPEACMIRCQRSTHDELVEIQQRAETDAAEAEHIEYIPMNESRCVIASISDVERIQMVDSLKSQLVKSTSTTFNLIGS